MRKIKVRIPVYNKILFPRKTETFKVCPNKSETFIIGFSEYDKD